MKIFVCTMILLFAACGLIAEKEPNNMFKKSSLTEVLETWIKKGGELEISLPDDDQTVKSEAEANVICKVLDTLRAEPTRLSNDIIDSPLENLAALFQQVKNQKAFDVLTQKGLPRLRTWVRDLLAGRDINHDDVMFIMNILAMYHQREDVDLIAQAALKPIEAENFLWSVIFAQFDDQHPYSADMIESLRNPLPSGFILLLYLDMANHRAIAGKLAQHPFDTEAGRKHLELWLRDKDEENFSYANSAAAALPFLEPSAQKWLLQIAVNHSNPSVRMKAMWTQAKSGDSAGIDGLAKLCLNPCLSYTVQQYLKELGHADSIPAETKCPAFQAIAEMANWLAHPSEYGQPPDNIELLDTRELFWPPTNDKRRLSLVKYSYNSEDGEEPDCGVGMVGSITFSLLGETTAELSPEDIYALHCCWELEMNKNPLAPKKRTAKAGRKILKRFNDGF